MTVINKDISGNSIIPSIAKRLFLLCFIYPENIFIIMEVAPETK